MFTRTTRRIVYNVRMRNAKRNAKLCASEYHAMSRTRHDATITHTLQCIVDDAFYAHINACATRAKTSCADFVRDALRSHTSYANAIDINTKSRKFANDDARNTFYANVAKTMRALQRELTHTNDDARMREIIDEMRALRS